MDELLDVLDSNGNYTGETILKSDAHRLGIFHPTVHIWCYTKTGKVLLQQRGGNKKTYPLKWDVSVAGHVAAGESIELGATREVQEEIGVTVTTDSLEKVGVFKTEKEHPNSILDCEFNHIFLCLLNENVALTKQESEVEALQWLSIKEFKQWIVNKSKYLVPNSQDRYELIISNIEEKF